MEYKRAHKFLYDRSVEKGFTNLADHIKRVGPLKITAVSYTHLTLPTT